MTDSSDVERDLEALLLAHAPGVSLLSPTRNVDAGTVAELIHHVVVAGSSLGAFAGLWKVFELFFVKHTSVGVKIIYESQDGARIEQSFTRLSQADAKKIVEAHPPKKHVLIQIFQQ